jgi:hypothetical protein
MDAAVDFLPHQAEAGLVLGRLTMKLMAMLSTPRVLSKAISRM